MDDDLKSHQTWHLNQLPSFYQQFLFIFYSVYKNKPRGVTIKDLIKFIKRNYYLDGDLCPQLITVLRQAIEQGVIDERHEKYYLVAPIASVQETAPNSPERKTELKKTNGIFNYNTTQRKSRGRRENNKKGCNNRNSDALKIDRPIIESSKRCGSTEKCSSVGLALQQKTLSDALRAQVSESPVTPPSKNVPNITVLSKIKQYFGGPVNCVKCQPKTASSRSKSSLTMKTATQNSNHSNHSKDISLRSHLVNSSDEYFSTHSKLQQCKSNSHNSKSKLGDSSQGISMQATRSKTPTQYTPSPSKKPSVARSSASQFSVAKNKSVLSFKPIISTFQHFLGCRECPKESPSSRTLRPRTTTSRNSNSRCGLYTPKCVGPKFRKMGRDKCNRQFGRLRKKSSKCRSCKVRIPKPSTVCSSRPFTRTSMQTRSSARGRCLTGYSTSKTGSLGRFNFSLKSLKLPKRKKKRKKCMTGVSSLLKMPTCKKRKLRTPDTSFGGSYWGDFCI